MIPRWLARMAEKSPAIAGVLARYPFERKLGKGAYKFVYASGDAAIGITAYDKQARDEIRYLGRLRSIGLPAVAVLEWVPAGKSWDGGAIVMRRYRQPRTITPRLLAQCLKIAAVLRRNRMNVVDLHVLLDGNKVVLADPLWIRRRTRGDNQEFKVTERLSIWIGSKGLVGSGM